MVLLVLIGLEVGLYKVMRADKLVPLSMNSFTVMLSVVMVTAGTITMVLGAASLTPSVCAVQQQKEAAKIEIEIRIVFMLFDLFLLLKPR